MDKLNEVNEEYQKPVIEGSITIKPKELGLIKNKIVSRSQSRDKISPNRSTILRDARVYLNVPLRVFKKTKEEPNKGKKRQPTIKHPEFENLLAVRTSTHTPEASSLEIIREVNNTRSQTELTAISMRNDTEPMKAILDIQEVKIESSNNSPNKLNCSRRKEI